MSRMSRWFGRHAAFLLLAVLAQVTGLALPDQVHAQSNTYGPPYSVYVFTKGSEVFPTLNQAIAAATAGYLAENPDVTCPIIVSPYTDPEDLQGGDVAGIGYPSTCGTLWAENTSITLFNFDYDVGKNLGACSCDGGIGNTGGISPGSTIKADPINAGTGNKFEQETDYLAPSDGLTFRRFYDSQGGLQSTTLGSQWRHSFDRSLALYSYSGEPTTVINAYRPDGKFEQFRRQSGGVWVTDPDVADTLTEQDNSSGTATGYTAFIAGTRQTEQYSATGLLQSITDPAGTVTTLTYSTATTPVSVAPAPNLLLTVIAPDGRHLAFTYNSLSQLQTVTQPDGGVLTYSYDSNGNLTSVQYPDGKTRQFVYNESAQTGGSNLPFALTGIIDETGSRYETTTYVPRASIDTVGWATSSSLAGGVETTTFSYSYPSYSVTMTTPLGVTTTLNLETIQGTFKVTGATQACGEDCNQPWSAQAYDNNGYPQSVTDFNGNVTATTYNSVGLITTEIDAQGTSNQRTTNTTWNTSLRVPLTKVVLDNNGNTVSSTAWVYNSAGQALARCDIDPTNSAASGYSCSNTGTVPAGVRRSTCTYCTAVDTVQCPLVGLMLTATGPRTDLTQTTTYSYYMSSSAVSCGTPGAPCYQPGDLYTVTDALGQVTTIASYDADGRITRMTDANGVNTDLTYTARGWLASITGDRGTATYGYTAYGNVSVINTRFSAINYTYDSAHRLTKIGDILGNYIQYTLDASGNRTAENTYAAGSTTPSRTLIRQFNTLGQLINVTDGLGHAVFNASASGSYDGNGNLVQSSDANGIAQQSSYDALNRLVKVVANYNGTDASTQNTTTQTAYDALDRLTQVIDPSSLTTAYSYDGLSNPTALQSPDTGSSSSTFDAAGNVLTHTDAKGVVSTSTYDALNRLLSVSYADSTQNITYAYDESNSATGCSSSYPVGRLTRIIENAVTTIYCYDAHGNVIAKNQVTSAGTDSTTYTYFLDDNSLTGITYPSGTAVTYRRDRDRRVVGITLTPNGGTATTVVSNVTYEPFGPVLNYTLGNGQTVTRSYDANYHLTDIASPAFTLHMARDAMGDITAIGNSVGANPATETYTYDPLYRLTAIAEADGSTLESVTYNQTGDRLSKSGTGLATGPYSYNTNTHQLIATGNAVRTVDANGNTTSVSQADSTYGFGYSDRNRMTVAQLAGATVGSYVYNAIGQRIQKVANSATERYDYDEDSQMLGEYGETSRDYIWMDGIPVANVDMSGSSSTIAYVTADQLGTPRTISNSSGTTEWQLPYQSNPWNEVAPTSSGYTYNFRSLGQYFDAETGLNYNVHRDYDSGSGRYIESDPLGLLGGSSTYAYVEGDPLGYYDPYGLWVWGDPLPQGVVDFSAGMGDTLSFGFTNFIRMKMGTNDVVDKCSRYYAGGELGGVVLGIGIGGGLGWEAAGEPGAGMEFSHWIPNRMGGPRSLWNGNYVSADTHALSDPFRYQFAPRSWKAENPMPNVVVQQWVRIPNVYKGMAAGAAAGGVSAALGDCSCQH